MGFICELRRVRKHHINSPFGWAKCGWVQGDCNNSTVERRVCSHMFMCAQPCKGYFLCWSISCILFHVKLSLNMSEGTELCAPFSSLLTRTVYILYYLFNAPRPWQQLVLRFGWELITPWRSPAKKEGMVLKGRKLRFSFLVSLFLMGKSNSMRCVICSMCGGCHQQSSLVPLPKLEITSVLLDLMDWTSWLLFNVPI